MAQIPTNPGPERSRVNSAPGRPVLIWGMVSLLVLAGALVALAMALQRCSTTMERMADKFAGLVKPNVDVTMILAGSVEKMQRQAKLVVATADITAEVDKSETYKWWGIYFGTTTARVRARGCKVQYAISLTQFTQANVEAMPSRNIVRVKVPEPVLDESIVEVNYADLEVFASSAWSRFNKGEVAEEAKRLLRQSAIEQGKKPWIQAAVRQDAEKTLRQALMPLSESLKPGVRLEIEFTAKH